MQAWGQWIEREPRGLLERIQAKHQAAERERGIQDVREQIEETRRLRMLRERQQIQRRGSDV